MQTKKAQSVHKKPPKKKTEKKIQKNRNQGDAIEATTRLQLALSVGLLAYNEQDMLEPQ